MNRHVCTLKSYDTITQCKYCNSRHIRRDGFRQNKSGQVQIIECRDCRRKFSANIGFRYRRYDPKMISEAMHMYFSGMSVRSITALFETRGIDVDPSAIYRWIERYGQVADKKMETLHPGVGRTWRADEIYVKIGGKMNYLFASMDDDTRYWLSNDLADRKEGHDATKLFRDTMNHADKIPNSMITDGLGSYREAARETMPLTKHVREIHVQGKYRGKDNNNKMERLNGTIRDREQNFRGVKTVETALFCGMRVHYNHARKHLSLEKRTPGEAAGISIEGADKWRTMIQNGSVHIHQTGDRV